MTTRVPPSICGASLQIVVIFTAALSGVLTEHSCTHQRDCSHLRYSSCQLAKTHDRVRCSRTCQCLPGYVMDGDKQACIKVSLIGEACQSSADCLPVHSECFQNSSCQCLSSYHSTSDGFHCLNSGTLGLGEPCNTGTSLSCGINQHCLDGSCACQEPMVPWTDAEKWSHLPITKWLQCKQKVSKQAECSPVIG